MGRGLFIEKVPLLTLGLQLTLLPASSFCAMNCCAVQGLGHAHEARSRHPRQLAVLSVSICFPPGPVGGYYTILLVVSSRQARRAIQPVTVAWQAFEPSQRSFMCQCTRCCIGSTSGRLALGSTSGIQLLPRGSSPPVWLLQ